MESARGRLALALATLLQRGVRPLRFVPRAHDLLLQRINLTRQLLRGTLGALIPLDGLLHRGHASRALQQTEETFEFVDLDLGL